MTHNQKHIDQAERRRLDGDKPTRKQIKAMLHRMRFITPMQSARVLDGIAQSMMPEKT
jgi:hypothetical protein